MFIFQLKKKMATFDSVAQTQAQSCLHGHTTEVHVSYMYKWLNS